MMQRRRETEGTRGDTKRPTITLTAFVHFQLNDLVGIYGPSLSEVVGFIIQSWLHENDANVTRQRRRFAAYRRSTISPQRKH